MSALRLRRRPDAGLVISITTTRGELETGRRDGGNYDENVYYPEMRREWRLTWKWGRLDSRWRYSIMSEIKRESKRDVLACHKI